MAQYDVPVTITATDKASGPLAKIAKAAKGAQSVVAKFGAVGGAALRGFAVATTGLNQGLELFKKGVEVFRAFTDKSREYRDENDKLIKSFDESNNLIGSLAARVGDVLINAFNAAIKAMTPLIKSFRTFLVTNQKLIGLKLIEYFRDFALLMTTGVAKSIVGVTRIVTFFALAWEAVKLAVNKSFQLLLNGVGMIIEGYANIASYIPGVGEKISKGMMKAAEGARALGDEFAESGETAKKEIESLLTEQELLEQQIGKVEKTIKNGIGKVAVAAMSGLTDASAGSNEKLGETAEKVGETTKEVKKLDTAIDETHAKSIAMAQGLAGLYDTIGTSFGQTFTALITGAEKSGEVFTKFIGESLQATIQLARNSIISAQLTAIANSAAGASFGGPLAIIGVTSIVAAIFETLLAKLPGMAEGGMVRGGRSGQDSVPALLMPGEYVMNVNQVEAMRQMFSNMDGVNSSGRFANGGTVGPGPSLGGVNITIRSEALPNKTEVAKYVRSTIMPAMRDLQAQGAI